MEEDAGERLTPEVLQRLYVQERCSIIEIAKKVGCMPGEVVRHLARQGLALRPRLPRRPVPLPPHDLSGD